MFIDVTNQLGFIDQKETSEVVQVDGFSVQHLAHPKFKKYTFEEMKSYFETLKSKYNLVVVLNEALTRSNKANMVMSISDTNMFVVDARNTSKKRVTEFELLKEEYEFSEMYFILNRNNFNPSILRDIYNLKDLGKHLKKVKLFFYKLSKIIQRLVHISKSIFKKNR